MRHRPRRSLTVRRAGAALVLPLALGLAACGGDADAPDGAEDASAASADTPGGPAQDSAEEKESPAPAPARKASDDDAAAVTSAVGQGDAGDSLAPEEFADLLDAAFSRATTAQVVMVNSYESMQATSEGVVDLTGDSPRMQLTMSGGPLPEGTSADIRLLDDALYMDTGFSGGKFVKVPAEQIAATGIDLSSIDPSRTARSFAAAATDVTYRGIEQVAGETLHRYSLTLDPAKLKTGGPAGQRAPKQIDHDVWFDADGLLRQVTTSMGQFGSTTVTYAAWGEPVSITAPPASDVMEMPQFPKSPRG